MIRNNEFVYKSCGEWVVIMKKLPDTITNETRSDVVDKFYAKFRANKLFVVKIVNKFSTEKSTDYVQNTFYLEKKITYVVNEEVCADNFDTNNDVMCGAGIHFFNSFKAAFFFEFPHKNFTGKYYSWHYNGQICDKGTLSNGKLTGLRIQWYINGNKKHETNYIDGMKNGRSTTWFHNGIKQSDENYVDNVLLKK
jgi:antitoxin component YwqK of YwqJK toxin-antitoxin module